MRRSDLWILVLARDPTGAKTRLSSILDADIRVGLVLAMLEDVLAAARGVTLARTFVATESDAVKAVAERSDVEILAVPRSGTNEAATYGLHAAAEAGTAAALVLAADLPLIARADIDALVEAARHAPVVIGSDRHRRGTNALLLSPPLAIAPGFGTDSCRVHRERARRARVGATVVLRRGLSYDIDEVEDLRLVLGDPFLGTRTAAFLALTTTA
jgi:2-phospho-L-lactate guanylyltransferase